MSIKFTTYPCPLIRQSKKGFSLIELLLSVFIVAGLLVAITTASKAYAERLLHIAMAQYVDQTRQAAYGLLRNPNIFETIYQTANNNPNGFLQTNIAQLRNGTIPVLVGFPAIPAVDNMENNFIDNTLFQNGLDIIFRVADNRAITTDVRELEIFIASNDLINLRRARGIASELGGYGGVLDSLTNIESAFASWTVPFNTLDNTAWDALVSANPPSIPLNQGYLVVYQHIDFEDVTGDYLYRNSIAGAPQLNRMFTRLDLGNNNILGIDGLGVDDLEGNLVDDPTTPGIDESLAFAAGSMTFNSRVILNQASLTVGNTAALNDGNIFIDGTITNPTVTSRRINQLTINGIGGDPDSTGQFITGGDITVTGTLTTANLEATTASFDQNVRLNQDLNSTNTTINSGTAVFDSIFSDTVNINTAKNTELNINNNLATGEMDVTNLTVNGGNTFGIVNSTITGTPTFNGLLSTGDLKINDLQVGTFGDCDNGC